MANEVFIDTSGFYASVVKDDDRHAAAKRVFAAARRNHRGFVTTDYVLDETATLLKARGRGHLLRPILDTLQDSAAVRIEWTDASRFSVVMAFFTKHTDQPWSFTDCLSFVVMGHLRLHDALTKDAHFTHAGFKALLV